MPDSKRKRGRADRRRVAGAQDYEVALVAKKFSIERRTVRAIIALVGTSRRKIYAELRRQGHRSS